MSDDFDFSRLHTAAGQASSAIDWAEQAAGVESDPGKVPDPKSLPGRIARVRELTAPDHTRTPEEDRELLALVAGLQNTEFAWAQNLGEVFQGAHAALQAIVGTATGRSPAASAAAVLGWEGISTQVAVPDADDSIDHLFNDVLFIIPKLRLAVNVLPLQIDRINRLEELLQKHVDHGNRLTAEEAGEADDIICEIIDKAGENLSEEYFGKLTEAHDLLLRMLQTGKGFHTPTLPGYPAAGGTAGADMLPALPLVGEPLAGDRSAPPGATTSRLVAVSSEPPTDEPEIKHGARVFGGRSPTGEHILVVSPLPGTHPPATTAEVEIRPAVAEDLPQIQALANKVWNTPKLRDDWGENGMAYTHFDQLMTLYPEESGPKAVPRGILVAVRGDEIVGYVAFEKIKLSSLGQNMPPLNHSPDGVHDPDGDIYYLVSHAIDPKARGKRLSESLFASLKGWASALEMRGIAVIWNHEHPYLPRAEDAQGLWGGYGFAFLDRTTNLNWSPVEGKRATGATVWGWSARGTRTPSGNPMDWLTPEENAFVHLRSVLSVLKDAIGDADKARELRESYVGKWPWMFVTRDLPLFVEAAKSQPEAALALKELFGKSPDIFTPPIARMVLKEAATNDNLAQTAAVMLVEAPDFFDESCFAPFVAGLVQTDSLRQMVINEGPRFEVMKSRVSVESVGSAQFRYIIDLPTASLVIEGNSARIKLHSDSKNTFNLELIRDLGILFTAVEQVDRVETVFIEGRRGNFSAGPDTDFLVSNLQSGGSGLSGILDYVRRGLRLLDAIDGSKKKVVAVVDGLASGAGFELALAADEIVTTEEAVFTQPETRFGIIPMFKGGYRLNQRIESSLAFVLQMIGDEREPSEEELRGFRIRGTMAYNYGVANHLVRDTEAAIRAISNGTDPESGEKRTTDRVEEVKVLFRNEGMRGQLIDGGELRSDDVYSYILSVAGQRPRAALVYAYQMMDMSDNEDVLKVLEYLLLTPMAYKGLRGEKVSVVSRTREGWGSALFGEQAGDYIVEPGREDDRPRGRSPSGPFLVIRGDSEKPYEGLVLTVRMKESEVKDAEIMRRAQKLVERLNEMDRKSEVDDLSLVRFEYPVAEGGLDRVKIARTFPMSSFSIIDETEGKPGGGRGTGTGTRTWPGVPVASGGTTQSARHSSVLHAGRNGEVDDGFDPLADEDDRRSGRRRSTGDPHIRDRGSHPVPEIRIESPRGRMGRIGSRGVFPKSFTGLSLPQRPQGLSGREAFPHSGLSSSADPLEVPVAPAVGLVQDFGNTLASRGKKGSRELGSDRWLGVIARATELARRTEGLSEVAVYLEGLRHEDRLSLHTRATQAENSLDQVYTQLIRHGNISLVRELRLREGGLSTEMKIVLLAASDMNRPEVLIATAGRVVSKSSSHTVIGPALSGVEGSSSHVVGPATQMPIRPVMPVIGR